MGQDNCGQPKLNEILRGLREASGRSQEQWGALLEVSRTSIMRYESGQTIPDARFQSELIKLCKRLGLLRQYGPKDGVLSNLNISEQSLDQLFQSTRSQNKLSLPQAGPSGGDGLPARRLRSRPKMSYTIVVTSLAVLMVIGAVSTYFVFINDPPVPVELNDVVSQFTETGNLERNTQVLEGSKVNINYDFEVAGQWFGVVYPVKDETLTTKHSILQVEILGDVDFEIKPNDIGIPISEVEDGVYELSTDQIGRPMTRLTLVVKRTINVPTTGSQTFIVRVRD